MKEAIIKLKKHGLSGREIIMFLKISRRNPMHDFAMGVTK